MYTYLRNFACFASIALALGSITSCDKLSSAYLFEGGLFTNFHKAGSYSVFDYADSVDAVLPTLSRKSSLVYTLGDSSLSVVRYSDNGSPVLYVQYGASRGNATIKRYVYVKNGEPLLVMAKESSSGMKKAFAVSNAHYDKTNEFYVEEHGSDPTERSTASLRQASWREKGSKSQLDLYEDVINQRGAFNLAFEGITRCPKSIYLILSRPEANSFRVSLKVEQEDEFIKILSSDPARYKGDQLSLQWKFNKNQEPVYLSGKLK